MDRRTDTTGLNQFIDGGVHRNSEKERLRFWLEMISDMSYNQQIRIIESIYLSMLRLRADARMIALIRAARDAQDSSTICLLVEQLLNQPYFRNG